MRLIGSFDSVVLAAVVPDLEALIGSRVQRVTQPAEHELMLSLRTPGRAATILCSIHPRWARIHLAPAQPPGAEAGPFAQMLRSRLEHARLASVHQIPFERILTLGFETDAGWVDLVAELMARHSNLILVQDGLIAGAFKLVPEQHSSVRQVLPGLPYRRPPAGRPSPAELTQDRLGNLLEASAEPLVDRLNTALLGISPTMAREIAHRAAVDPEAPARTLPPDAARIFGVLAALARIVERRAFTPVVYLDGDAPRGYAPFPLLHVVGLIPEPASSMSEAVARVTTQLSESAALEEVRTSLLTAIRTALAKVERTEQEVRRGLEEASGGEAVRRRGELLLAYASQIIAGAAEATVPGYDGVPVTIPLDPALTPVENARKLFARYTKIRRARPALEGRLGQLAEERAYLESALTMAEQAVHVADLQELRRELADEGYLRRRGRRPPTAAPRPRSFTLTDGATILAGRTNQDNDRLTFKVAAPDDLWFHARGLPGAHVILRTGGRPAREGEIAQAAAVAAYFSKGRSSGSVAVDYTPRRFVRKPKGRRPGFVVYVREETVRVAPALP